MTRGALITSSTKHSLQNLSGVGPQLAAKLEKIGILIPEDLLFHLPLRYQDRTKLTPIADLRAGVEAVIVGQIDAADVRFGRRRSLIVSVSDQSSVIVVRFFHFTKNQQLSFKPGAWIQCFGEVRRGPKSLEMVHPQYKIFQQQPKPTLQKSLTAVYPSTKGVGPAAIRKLVDQALDRHLDNLQEILPAALQNEFGLMPLSQALLTAHRPRPDANTVALLNGAHVAQQRLALEELLAHHLALNQLRQKRYREFAPKIVTCGRSWNRLIKDLNFDLTVAQHRVIKALFSDMSKGQPMLRLVQGDVGSGKTVVAAAAALHAIDNGFQVALMAPTELLAEQHRKTFHVWFDKLGIEIEWLTGKLTTANRRNAIARIASGQAKMIIGTHALFQTQVEFNRLGLMIIDEQHRFGVDQRLALRSKGNLENAVPHQIIMSATPIPRSLAMIFYADLDVSSIDELPPGRKSVHTVALPSTRRQEVASRIRSVCQSGQQAYWVCPLIEESEKLQAQAATETHAILKTLLPELEVELIHGRLNSKDKESIMQRFSDGDIDLLVSTTVIEVGVDVANASLMIIENAERLGLAQLHQLRGRVGRGVDQAACVLMYQPPLGTLAKERLGILRDTNDGFKIAQKDLEQRGPGDLLGTRQTGLQQLRIADLARDKSLLPKIEKIAGKLQQDYPHLIQPLVERWIVNSDQYANV
ncbi:ATP-dependent DNA helicase RecG [Candidatus Spongiihabitans sp.]|uniref:ATP-dependent DNA helicase RecG n=1 Tax=Candidatus Spongiihabitans sp. TaxID=3101308 RepID=UPI003C702C1F